MWMWNGFAASLDRQANGSRLFKGPRLRWGLDVRGAAVRPGGVWPRVSVFP